MNSNNLDEIVQEVRSARQTYAVKFGYDVRRIMEDLQTKEQQHPELVASLRDQWSR